MAEARETSRQWTREIKIVVVGVGEAVLLSEVQVRPRMVTSCLVNQLLFCRPPTPHNARLQLAATGAII